MSPEECVGVYQNMPRKIFGKRRVKKLWWLLTSAQHSTDRQRRTYAKVVREALGSADAPLRPDHNYARSEGNAKQCPVFVVAVDTEDVSHPVIFSSYSTASSTEKGSSKDHHSDISIVSAALATSAAPTFFHPTAHAGRRFIDGGIGFNNPSEIAVKQLSHLYGHNAYADTIISLGTGCRGRNPYAVSMRTGLSGMFGMLRAFAHISTDSEAVHRRMDERFAQTGAYYRFNPPGLEDIALDEWTAVGRAAERSQAYLDMPETQARIAEVAKRLLAARAAHA